MKILNWFKENIFLFFTIFLLAFIPLYPKIPLFGLTHINVYVRAEDFIVLFFVLVYLLQLLRRKEDLRTPITIAIIIFWITGLTSTVLGLIFIFPHLTNDPTITANTGVYTRNAFLFYARHIEYMSLFFIAFAGIKSKKSIKVVIPVIIGVFLIVVLYAYGQRFVPQYFPAFSTMNEEFAKGIPLVLDAAGRIQSTFAGHYDFSAFLVMLIPLIGSLIFGYKRWSVRIGLLLIDLLAFVALLMTQSRTSFAMYLLAVIFMLIIQKQKKWIVPVIIVSLLLLRTFSGLYARYSATFSVVNRIVDARTGKVIGYGDNVNGKFVVNNIQPSGHDLYAGSLSTTGRKIGNANSITIKSQKSNSKSIDVENLQGDFIIQKASALDASITTRLQAEWPNAMNAFNRDILFGSGYSSITLATDGNYFRFLGETGLLGFAAFGLIFLIYAIYAAKIIPQIEDPLSRSFVIGVSAGIFGLGLNATLIDVFESSKIAYSLWLLVGVAFGTMLKYNKKPINIIKEIKVILSSVFSQVIYLVILSIIFFWKMLNNFFVADDFTWLRWVGDCSKLIQNGVSNCENKANVLSRFFTNSSDFFYRPGMKIYFYLLYNSQFGGINPVMYHVISLVLHIACTILVLLISRKILKNNYFSFVVAVVFLLLGSHAEAIYWISSVGHLFVSFFVLLGLWFYLKWSGNKKIIFLILSVIAAFMAPLFHESGVVAPITIVSYGIIVGMFSDKEKKSPVKNYIFYLISILFYFVLKVISHSFWSAGDYKYNLVRLPFNVFGNLIGFLGFVFVGNSFLSSYQIVRDSAKNNLVIVTICIFVLIAILVLIYQKVYKVLNSADKQNVALSIAFFVIPLLSFLPLGNIAPRYAYLAAFGLILFVVVILEKIYLYLNTQNKYLSLLAVILIPVLFISTQIPNLRKENEDWQKAGIITNNFVQYMNDGFEDLQLGIIKYPVFYFVNVPQRNNYALVFPVNIDDAAWFVFKDKKLETHIISSVDLAKELAGANPHARVFVFDKAGFVSIIK